jgi:dolichyl-phosphate beta-glucosyltransferase
MTAATPAGRPPHVTFVIPAYNEEARLPGSLDRVIAFLAAQPFESEIIVSDDGSIDRTGEIVRARQDGALPARVQLRALRSGANRGKGAAIRDGVMAAGGDYVFFIDADLATPPEDALPLLDRLEGGADVAIGSRIQPDGTDMRVSQPLQRRLAGRAYTLLRKALRLLPDIDDTQCPLKGFRRDAARAIFPRQRLRGWIFDAEVLQIARGLGYSIAVSPVTWRHVEGSRLRVTARQAFDVTRDLLRLRFRR